MLSKPLNISWVSASGWERVQVNFDMLYHRTRTRHPLSITSCPQSPTR